MKRITSCSMLAIIVSITGISQTVIVEEIHGLKPGINNQMIYTEYTSPGFSGADIIWDFSFLPNSKSFTGFLNPSATSKIGSAFLGANTELIEFDSRFYFNVSSYMIQELGYSSSDGKSQIRYDNPSVKMKYPFRYGDSFSGMLSGNSFYNGVKSGTIKGTYLVEADAYGRLILPNGQNFNNTLRVRSEKNYINDFGGSTQEVNIVTYRWYDMGHRYPLLAFTEYSTIVSGNKTSHYQAAYNNNSPSLIDNLSEEEASLYPNPSAAELSLVMNAAKAGLLKIDILSTSGEKIKSFQYNVSQSGSTSYDLSSEISGLKPAGYLLIITNGEKIYVRNFTLIE